MVTPMQTNFMSTWSCWAGTSAIFSCAAVHLLPRLSVGGSYLWTAVACFLAQWAVYSVYAVILYPHYLSPLRHLPEPGGGSYFNGQWSRLMAEPSGIPLRQWLEEVPNDGIIRYRHLFNRERLFVTSPKGLAEVLTTKCYDFIKPSILRDGIAKLLGVGMLFAEGDEHKSMRKNFAPAFTFRHIKELYPIFWQKSREMVQTIEIEELRSKTDNETIEVSEWASRATLDIIGVAGMGQDFNSLREPGAEINTIYRKIFAPNRSAQLLAVLQFFLPNVLLRLLPVKRNDDMRAAAKFAKGTSLRLVRQRKEKLEKKEKMPPDIISIALEAGNLTEEDLVNNMMNFLAAGHETTATAFTWAIYLLCQHPDVQERLRTEVHVHVKNLTDEIDCNLIDGMPYLHAVCQEVLRSYGPVPLTIRDAAVDTSILGQFVPRGTKIIVAPWAVNFSKELWGPDADEFRPDRWTRPGQANSGGAVSNYAFLTFLHGPRSCIGARFAVGELACLLAAFVGKFKFELSDPQYEPEVKGGITARPRDGVKVNIKVTDEWRCGKQA